jgi:hypothetical protein
MERNAMSIHDATDNLLSRHADFLARGDLGRARALAGAVAGDAELAALMRVAERLHDALQPVGTDPVFRAALGRGLRAGAERLLAPAPRRLLRLPRPRWLPARPTAPRRALRLGRAAAAVGVLLAVWWWERGGRPPLS